jgi:hypothetical protein
MLLTCMLTLVTSSTADWRMELPEAAARRRSVPPNGSNPVPSRASCTVQYSMLEGVTASIQKEGGIHSIPTQVRYGQVMQ